MMKGEFYNGVLMRLSRGTEMQNKISKIIAATALFQLAVMVPNANAARVDARLLTCIDATNIVKSHGQFVFTLTNNTYDRIVKNRNYCSSQEVARNVYTPTLDNPRCNIGKKCVLGNGIED